MRALLTLPTLLAITVSTAILSTSCKTRPAGLVQGGLIPKVKVTELDTSNPKAGIDPSISFEEAHHRYGAISPDERRAMDGHYYTVYWEVDNPVATVVRLEYRQQNSRDRVRRQDLLVNAPGGKNVTKFAVAGEAHEVGGPVTAWRATLLQSGKVVATYESFLWK